MTAQSTESRSPLHPNALTLKDMTVGRKIITFNIAYGILERSTIVEAPHPFHTDEFEGFPNGYLVYYIERPSILTGEPVRERRFCTDNGVAPEGEHHWNTRNFTIDASDERLLPEPNASLREPNTYSYYEDDNSYAMEEVEEEVEE